MFRMKFTAHSYRQLHQKSGMRLAVEVMLNGRYGRRCHSSGGGWDGGIRRVDWLREKTHLIDVEVDKVSGSKVGNLVFGKA